MTRKKVVPGTAILEPKAERNITNNDPVFIYSFYYFAHHEFI